VLSFHQEWILKIPFTEEDDTINPLRLLRHIAHRHSYITLVLSSIQTSFLSLSYQIPVVNQFDLLRRCRTTGRCVTCSGRIPRTPRAGASHPEVNINQRSVVDPNRLCSDPDTEPNRIRLRSDSDPTEIFRIIFKLKHFHF